MEVMINNFLEDINSQLDDFLTVVQISSDDIPVFSLFLRENDFIMECQIALKRDTKYHDVVREACAKHFGKTPQFNNTGKTFWFY